MDSRKKQVNSKKDSEISSLKKKIKTLEKIITILNENILDTTSINEQTIKLVENLTSEVLVLKQKSNRMDENKKSIFKWIENQNKFVDYSVEKMSKFNKSISDLEKDRKIDSEKLLSSITIDNLKNTIKILTDNDEKTAKSISDINKTLLMLSQNDNKLAEALFDMSKKIDEIVASLDSNYDIEKLNEVKTFIIAKKNYLIFNIHKPLKKFAYESIVEYLNSIPGLKNIYFYFNLSDEVDSENECSMFSKIYLRKIRQKNIELMYE